MTDALPTKVGGIEYVTLISSDGYSYIVDRRCALLSAPLRSTLGDHSSKSVELGKNVATSGSIAVEEPPSTTLVTPSLATDTMPAMNKADPDGYVNPFAPNASNSDSEANAGGSRGKKNGLEGGFAEARSSRITLPMRGIVLEKVVEYLCWLGRYQNAKDADIPKFEPRIMPEIALELLMASDYLDV